MKLNIYSDKEISSRAAADLIVEQVRVKPDSLLCFPSGDSPTLVLKYLVDYGMQGTVDFSQCRFVGLDEWIGMDERDEGSCRHYMNAHFFMPLKISPDKIIFFNGLADNPDDECALMDAYILKNGPIDIMMVGLGMNGHIGLNEPGTDFKLYAHRTELHPLTVQIAQKYFKKTTPLTGGLTLGLQHFTEAKTAVLIISGAKKAEILAKILETEVTEDVPGTIIQLHPHAVVFADADAASKLTRPIAIPGDKK
jgi:glucosamine-6-phosphate deaminase